MEFCGIVVVWVILSIAVGWYWDRKGGSFAYGLLAGLFLSPLVGFIIGLVLEPNIKKVEEKKLKEGDMMKCPYCAELIKKEAKVCRYCGRDIGQASPNP